MWCYDYVAYCCTTIIQTNKETLHKSGILNSLDYFRSLNKLITVDYGNLVADSSSDFCDPKNNMLLLIITSTF